MKQQKYSTLGLILMFLKGSKKYFVLTVLSALGMTLTEMLPPQIIKFTVDSVIGNADPDLPQAMLAVLDKMGGVDAFRAHLWWSAVGVAVAALLSAVCRYGFRLYNTKASETLVESMRNRIFDHIQCLPFAWHMENQTGDIIQRCTSDVDMVRNFLSEQLTAVFRIVTLLTLSLWFMVQLNGTLTLVSVGMLTLVLLYSMFFHKQIGSGFAKADAKEGDLSAIAQENLTGVRVVRAFGREEYERQRFYECDKEYSALWMKLCIKLSTFWTSTSFISGMQVMMIVVLGAAFCVSGNMTAGAYIAFISYNAMLTWPVRQLGRMISEMSKAGVSIERIKHIMNSAAEQDKPEALTPPLDRDIIFDNVSFRYGNAKVLDSVSFTIKAGETLGILGSTGSGKSTLMYLLDRLYELPPEGGKITVGGVDIADIKAEHLRRHIGMVLQEPYLFSRTIEQNIGIAMEDADAEDIREAARAADLHESIEGFAAGYDTFVGERGVTLSGGQKQRTAIARMLLRPTPIMILDDSLSAVDTETDAHIRKALRRKTKGSTTILISHRITTLMQADQIIVLDKGRIIERGSHRELLEKNGVYRKIYDMQSRKEEADV
ncbi:MAG: ABC transporter ATP-binding protein [Clostridia bacterium]|nr:ABC transporter ATP-binding protein [Clostridia bacterium]